MTRLAFGVLSIGLLAASVHPHAQPQVQQQTKAYSPLEQQLSRGITLYATDDDSADAEKLFTRIIATKPATTREGETALYYLGRYYHRNYYMLRQPALLNSAVTRYTQLHQQVDRTRMASLWYAEARFYKGLAYLQQGLWAEAYQAVDQIDVRLDANADLDYLVWSYDKRTLNRRVPTQTLKEEYLRILNAQGVQKRPRGQADRSTFDTIISQLENALGRKALSRAY